MFGGVLGYLSYATFSKSQSSEQFPNVSWKLPAVFSLGFGLFSVYTIAQEGVTMVWENHTQNFWGNQVWFDLLFSVGLFWLALAPRAAKLGMPVVPWFFYILSTASIGGLHLFARILYLEERLAESDPQQPGPSTPLNKN